MEASVEIDKRPQDVWDYVSRIDDWWLVSNPKEHIELSVVGDGGIYEGTQLVLKERIAGVRGEALVKVAEFDPPSKLVWVSIRAKYRLLGLSLAVEEGGTFRISNRGDGCVLSHRVWGKLRAGPVSGLLEWLFRNVLKGERKDFEHSQRELVCIKDRIESRGD